MIANWKTQETQFYGKGKTIVRKSVFGICAPQNYYLCNPAASAFEGHPAKNFKRFTVWLCGCKAGVNTERSNKEIIMAII